MLVKIERIKANPKNPRILKDSKYNSLKKSLEDFPEMLQKRPLVVFTDKDDKFVVLGGNMRFKVAKELGFKELPIILADDWTEEQKTQFLIKDNVNYGDWDWDALANEWDSLELTDWGLDIPNFKIDDIDYSILEDENLDEEINEMANGVKKAIQIEFELGDYSEAQELIKILREDEIYIGGLVLEALRKTKK
jgi:ParB-like chromosome segregation protein Spo0J